LVFVEARAISDAAIEESNEVRERVGRRLRGIKN
jgi:hypothetical protein